MTKILAFEHSEDCKMILMTLKRKEKIKTFEIRGNSGWETTEKLNKLMNCLMK